jgi:hypothetical protein
MVVRSIISWI